MVEGKLDIFLSYKEPEYRDNILWLRPYLDREGYELLYYGANGWTRLVPCHPDPHSDIPKEEPDTPLTDINPDINDKLYEITPTIIPPDRKPSCGCPD